MLVVDGDGVFGYCRRDVARAAVDFERNEPMAIHGASYCLWLRLRSERELVENFSLVWIKNPVKASFSPNWIGCSRLLGVTSNSMAAPACHPDLKHWTISTHMAIYFEFKHVFGAD